MTETLVKVPVAYFKYTNESLLLWKNYMRHSSTADNNNRGDGNYSTIYYDKKHHVKQTLSLHTDCVMCRCSRYDIYSSIYYIDAVVHVILLLAHGYTGVKKVSRMWLCTNHTYLSCPLRPIPAECNERMYRFF